MMENGVFIDFHYMEKHSKGFGEYQSLFLCILMKNMVGEFVMNQKVYLKIDRNNEVHETSVRISDVAKVYCTDKSVVNKIKTLEVVKVQPKDKARVSVSALKVIEVIQSEYPGADIENIGEQDFIVDYIDEKKKNGVNKKILNIVKVTMICIITFMGSAYAIMAYDNDVGTKEIFEKAYEMLLDEPKGDSKWMEMMYSLGLTVGIAAFYNHFGGKSFTNDPTPIEVEMNSYEKDIDYALIERGSRSNKEEDVS